jgi:hypothetical protein
VNLHLLQHSEAFLELIPHNYTYYKQFYLRHTNSWRNKNCNYVACALKIIIHWEHLNTASLSMTWNSFLCFTTN